MAVFFASLVRCAEGTEGAMTDDIARGAEGQQGGAQAQPPALQLVYANSASLRGGPFDIAIDFGHVVGPATESGEALPLTQWIVRVALSWEHARAIHRLLGEQLSQYEARVGAIPDIEQLKTGDQ